MKRHLQNNVVIYDVMGNAVGVQSEFWVEEFGTDSQFHTAMASTTVDLDPVVTLNFFQMLENALEYRMRSEGVWGG